MDLTWMLGQVPHAVQAAFAGFHGHLRKTLIAAAEAMLLEGSCQLSRMAWVAGSRAKVPSRERRFQRLVSNPRLKMDVAMEAWAAWRLADSAQITLILDETPQHNYLRAMKLALQVRGRAVPVLWQCYRPHELPDRQDRMVLQILALAARLVPAHAQVQLLADRGLAWASVLDFCAVYGWSCILRPQGHTRVRLGQGKELRIDELVPRPGTEWRGRVEAFKNAGWRNCTAMASWQAEHTEPWLLITNLPPTRPCFRQYCKRTRIEEAFRDEKSYGFQWQASRVRIPEHASRLLLVIAIAMSVAIRIGLRLIKTGRRHEVEPRHKRRNSVFRLGLCKLHSLARPLQPPA